MKARLLATSVLAALMVAGALAQAPVRGHVGGRVLDTAHHPVRGALVLLAGTDITLSRVTATDADGRFAFEGVPNGHVLLVAGKPAYLAALYGAAYAGRPGKVVAVGADRTADLVITLEQGAALSGHVVDNLGQPVVGARIRVFARRQVGDDVVLGADVGEPAAATTDETGAYRVFDLPPGAYVIGLAPKGIGPGDAVLGRPPEPPAEPLTTQGTSVGYAPVYYPSAATPHEATPVTLTAGADKTGLDLKTTIVRFGRIDGVIGGVDGSVPANQVQIRPKGWTDSGSLLFSQTTRAGIDGHFALTNVPPGEYAIVARTLPPPPDPSEGPDHRRPVIWALANLATTGADSHVVLRWEAALTVTGHVTFAGLAHPPDDITVRIGVRPTPASGNPPVPPPVAVDAAGRFTIAGVLPGEYWLTVQVPANPGTQFADWIPGSAVIDGHDAFDEPFAVAAGLGMPDIPVVLTRETQQIDGALKDDAGKPVVDCPVVVFSTDPRYWFPQSRHIAVRRTDTTGGWLFNLAAGLPPGDYFVGAVPDLGPNEQFDADLLGALAVSAHRVIVPRGGSATLQLRIPHPQ